MNLLTQLLYKLFCARGRHAWELLPPLFGSFDKQVMLDTPRWRCRRCGEKRTWRETLHSLDWLAGFLLLFTIGASLWPCDSIALRCYVITQPNGMTMTCCDYGAFISCQ